MSLADKINRNSFTIKIKGAAVKVPRLKAKAKAKLRAPVTNDQAVTLSAIVNAISKKAAEISMRETKQAKPADDKKYKAIKEELAPASGYAAASKSYGISIHKPYVDYGKLFSYLGKFKAQTPYQNLEEEPITSVISSQIESKAFTLIERETMDKGARYIKYFLPKGANIDPSSLVPIAGMSSGEWEQFKLWMKLDPVMYMLKTTLA